MWLQISNTCRLVCTWECSVCLFSVFFFCLFLSPHVLRDPLTQTYTGASLKEGSGGLHSVRVPQIFTPTLLKLKILPSTKIQIPPPLSDGSAPFPLSKMGHAAAPQENRGKHAPIFFTPLRFHPPHTPLSPLHLFAKELLC